MYIKKKHQQNSNKSKIKYFLYYVYELSQIFRVTRICIKFGLILFWKRNCDAVIFNNNYRDSKNL